MNRKIKISPVTGGFVFLLIVVLSACNALPGSWSRGRFAAADRRLDAPTQTTTQTSTAIVTQTKTSTVTATATATSTATATETPLPTDTPTVTPVPTDTATPTPSVPVATAKMRAFCRYGPGTAYLYSYELKEGAQALVEGRDASGDWLWLQPPDLDRHCWSAASVLDVTGDVNDVPIVESRLPFANDLYGPPQNIRTDRDGDQVTITWDAVEMTEDDDRGYLIQAHVCQDGAMLWVAIQTYANSVQITDERGCSEDSSGQIYTVEKHGYVNPVSIPWP